MKGSFLMNRLRDAAADISTSLRDFSDNSRTAKAEVPKFFSCDSFSNMCTFDATLYNRFSYLSFA